MRRTNDKSCDEAIKKLINFSALHDFEIKLTDQECEGLYRQVCAPIWELINEKIIEMIRNKR